MADQENKPASESSECKSKLERYDSTPSDSRVRDGSDPFQEGKLIGGEEAMTKILVEACDRGEVSTVKLMLHFENDLSAVKSPNTNRGPLHYASLNGHQEIVQLLLDKKFHVSMEDANGNTALHLAASGGHLETVSKILDFESQCNEEVSESQRTNLLEILNKDGLSLLGSALKASAPGPHFNVAKHCLKISTGNPPDIFLDFGRSYLNGYSTSPLDKPVKIFVIGDSGVGKSTLTKALQEERSVLSRITFGLAASGRRIRSMEDQHFTGVITTDFYSQNSKRVIFYDLASHTNYCSKDLVESSYDIHHSVFIILVNLKYEHTKIMQRLVFWLNFLHYHLSAHIDQTEDLKPNVLVIGSHRDATGRFKRNSERLTRVFKTMEQQHPILARSFNFILKPLSLDCRKFQTADMRQLRGILDRTCLRLSANGPLPPSMCYILSSLLDSDDFGSLPALTIRKLSSIISTCSSKQDLSLYHLLPTDVDQLLDICKSLCDHQRINLFPNPKRPQSVEDMWIVHDSHLILTEIDTKLASLKGMDPATSEDVSFLEKQRRLQLSFGIITYDFLDQALSEITQNVESDFVLDTDLLVQLLLHFKYTEPIESSSLELANQSFFLPSLLQELGEADRWECNNLGFALSIVPSKSQNQDSVIVYFLPRFLKKLLLRLIQDFILPNTKSPQPNLDSESSECTSQSSISENSVVWSRGVSWLTIDGICVNIVTNDDAIILSMRSDPGHEISCINLRNKIVETILEEQRKWQGSTETEIFILPFKDRNITLPVETFESKHWISLRSIEDHIIKERSAAYSEVDLRSLFYCDPGVFMLMWTPETLQLLSDSNNSTIKMESEVLVNIYESFGKSEEAIVDHFRLPITKFDKQSKEPTHTDECVPVVEIVVEEDLDVFTDKPFSRPEEPSGTLTPKQEDPFPADTSVTCEEFVTLMSSISLFNVVHLLNEIKKEHVRSKNSSNNGGDNEDDDSDSDEFNSLVIITHPRETSPPDPPANYEKLYQSACPLPFVGQNVTLKYSGDEVNFVWKEHGIAIRIPKGALPCPTTIELGVLLDGPFRFPQNSKLVSTILWICGKKRKQLNFLKPIKIDLPHIIDCSNPEQSKNLTFAKAAHDSSLSDRPFVFNEISDSTYFGTRSGTLSTKHACFLCILHKVPSQVIKNANYCLIKVFPKGAAPDMFEMNFCVTYALKTCIENVCKQFPDCDIKRQTFKFACLDDESDPAIRIEFDNRLKFGWIAGRVNLRDEIHASEVKFSSESSWYEDDEYPPRFTIEVVGVTATDCEILYISFTGTTRKLELQKPLAIVPGQIRTPRESISQTTSMTSIISKPDRQSALGILERNIVAIRKYLDMDQIRPVLTEQGTLLPEEQDRLLHLGRSQEPLKRNIAIETLVRMMQHKGCRGIQNFIFALERTGDQCLGHRDVIRILKEDNYVDYEYLINLDSYNSVI